MKKIFRLSILLLFLSCQSLCLANMDTVNLTPEEITRIKVPQTHNLSEINKKDDDIDDYCGFYSDEDVFESKAGKTFSKIIDNVVINNKFNKYTNNITDYSK